MIIVLPATAVLKGRDHNGQEALTPVPSYALIIGGKPDAQAARFLGYLGGLSKAFQQKAGLYAPK